MKECSYAEGLNAPALFLGFIQSLRFCIMFLLGFVQYERDMPGEKGGKDIKNVTSMTYCLSMWLQHATLPGNTFKTLFSPC